MDSFSVKILIDSLAIQVHKILDFVMQELIEEYEQQGHKMTGALADSMRKEVQTLSDGVLGIIYINDYYKYLDKGVTANKIPFNPGSGKKRSKYIDGLINFFKQKLHLGDEEAKGAAFATAWKHKQEGMPTSGSYAFSNNGRRLDFFTGTIERSQQQIQQGIEEIYSGAMQLVLKQLNAQLIGEINITL